MRSLRRRIPVSLLLLPLLTVVRANALPAQAPPPDAAAAAPGGLALAGPSRADTDAIPAQAPFGRLLLGAAAGGAVFMAPGLLVATLPCHELVCNSQLAGGVAAIVGYVVGAAVGARLAATTHGARPGFGKVLGASMLAAALGGIVWNRVGEALEPKEPGSVDYSSWQWGAALGITLHLTVTSLVAQRNVTPAQPVPAPPGIGAVRAAAQAEGAGGDGRGGVVVADGCERESERCPT